MRAFLALALMASISHARRVQASFKRPASSAKTSLASILLAFQPSWAGAAHSNSQGRSTPVAVQPSLAGAARLSLNPQASSGEEGDPVDVYVSPVSTDDKLSEEDVIDVEMGTETKPKPAVKPFAEETDFDVIVVGAGCAGVGTATMLTRTFGLDNSKVLLVEQGEKVGDSFRKWPEEMRFISPSFNQQGWTASFDLNAVHYETSPAFSLRTEHPSGTDYARYLESIAETGGLQVWLNTKVTSIRDVGKKDDDHPGPFKVVVRQEEDGVAKSVWLTSRYIVWAAGEFQYPREKEVVTTESVSKEHDGNENENSEDKKGQKNPDSSLPKVGAGSIFPGAKLCIHNSRVRSWKKLPGDDFIIIGGYESGIDAAFNLATAGKKCKVLASTPCWNMRTGDPSSELAPYTADRLRSVLSENFSPQPELLAPLRVISVDEAKGGGFDITAKWKAVDEETFPNWSVIRTEEPGQKDSVVVLHSKQAPVLCTGFEGSVAAQAGHLFDFPEEGETKGCIGNGPLLTRNDESTKVPGVFLVGPSVTHGPLSFCFVYKFRQRFAVVANAICQGLGMDTEEAVAQCRRTNMYLDDFAVCEDTCGDDC